MAGRHGVLALALLLALLAWGGQRVLAPGWLAALEERSADLAWRLGADRRDERRLIVVDIDERSLRDVGPWPWPRATQARLVAQLAGAGASLQILDVVFTDPRPDDDTMRLAVQDHHPVLAQVFALEQGSPVTAGKLAGALDWSSCGAPFSVAHGYLANLPELAGLPGVAASTQVMMLDLEAYMVSAGAACSSGKVKASHVLAAMGLGPAAGEAIRVSLSPATTDAEIDAFAAAWLAMAARLGRKGAA